MQFDASGLRFAFYALSWNVVRHKQPWQQNRELARNSHEDGKTRGPDDLRSSDSLHSSMLNEEVTHRFLGPQRHKPDRRP